MTTFEKLDKIKQQLRDWKLPANMHDPNFNSVHAIRLRLHRERILLLKGIDKLGK